MVIPNGAMTCLSFPFHQANWPWAAAQGAVSCGGSFHSSGVLATSRSEEVQNGKGGSLTHRPSSAVSLSHKMLQ